MGTSRGGGNGLRPGVVLARRQYCPNSHAFTASLDSCLRGAVAAFSREQGYSDAVAVVANLTNRRGYCSTKFTGGVTMVKYTLAEAQAYFATRHMRLSESWDGRYRVEFTNSTFSARLYKTLDGAVKSITFDKGGEFEKWLIGYRTQVRQAVGV